MVEEAEKLGDAEEAEGAEESAEAGSKEGSLDGSQNGESESPQKVLKKVHQLYKSTYTMKEISSYFDTDDGEETCEQI